MTISDSINRVGYTGNGATSTYSFGFKIFSSDELLVTVRNTSNVESTLELTTDYTVTINGVSGGSITLVAGNLASGYVISIRRVVTIDQGTDIKNAGQFYPKALEDQFDLCVMIDLQQQDELDRSIKLPETVPGSSFDTTLPASIAGAGSKFIATNADGDGFALFDGVSSDSVAITSNTGILSKINSDITEARTITGTSNQITISNGDGISGNPTVSITSDPIIPGTAKVRLPTGTTGQRPVTPVAGDMRYNSTTGYVEGYQNSVWTQLGIPNDSSITTSKISTLAVANTPGYIYGLNMSNNSSDSSNDIDIAIGVACSSDYSVMMNLSSSITIQIDVSGVNGLDTGSVAMNTTYHVYLIMRDSDNAIRGLFSTSASSPTMPSGYTKKRRIGSIMTNSSSTIRQFYQKNNRFYHLSHIQEFDLAASTFSTSAVLKTLTVPSGIQVFAMLCPVITNDNAVLITYPGLTDEATSISGPSTSGSDYNSSSSFTVQSIGTIEILTNTSAQVRVKSESTNGNIKCYTRGWIDER